MEVTSISDKSGSWAVPHSLAVIGAGPGVSALHLPVLARLDQRFVPTAFADGGSGRARALAQSFGVSYSADVAGLLAEVRPDAVLVCSPPAEHAAHVRAALDAGVRGILCEKPLALTADDARDLVHAAREAGAALVVGTNHVYDAAWDRAKHHLLVSGGDILSVSVTMSLQPNERYHDMVTEAAHVRPAHRGAPPQFDAEARASIVWQLLTGLGVHDMPAIRDLLPGAVEVEAARFVDPVGYIVLYRAGGVPVQLSAVMRGDGADTFWRLTVVTTHDRVDVDFPPPFVHAGSAEVRVRSGSGRETVYPREAEDGYEREWAALAQLMAGEIVVEGEELVGDALYSLEIAEQAARLVREHTL